MTPSQATRDESLTGERELAETILELAAGRRLPSREEIERAAREAMRKVLAQRGRGEN